MKAKTTKKYAQQKRERGFCLDKMGSKSNRGDSDKRRLRYSAHKSARLKKLSDSLKCKAPKFNIKVLKEVHYFLVIYRFLAVANKHKVALLFL